MGSLVEGPVCGVLGALVEGPAQGRGPLMVRGGVGDMVSCGMTWYGMGYGMACHTVAWHGGGMAWAANSVRSMHPWYYHFYYN